VPSDVPPHRIVEAIRDAAAALSTYTAVAAAASNDVTLRVNGRKVSLKPDGSFAVRTRSTPVVAVATDGAGNNTSKSYR
jgi:hypothetical protein